MLRKMRILVLFALLGLMAAACGEKEKPAEEPGPAAVEPAAEPEPAVEPEPEPEPEPDLPPPPPELPPVSADRGSLKTTADLFCMAMEAGDGYELVGLAFPDELVELLAPDIRQMFEMQVEYEEDPDELVALEMVLAIEDDKAFIAELIGRELADSEVVSLCTAAMVEEVECDEDDLAEAAEVGLDIEACGDVELLIVDAQGDEEELYLDAFKLGGKWYIFLD